ncbi:hypothetical protein RND71_005664 [Anisodus tanguticus]|uniref:Uncharacterized protein n=1 Tax=Anisodus tanguticus TaxID=243964 RepID=A0AAE1STJ4_9SOLA|nr:hypothetical protein RND71_005664 [Anisodus tanguticus]
MNSFKMNKIVFTQILRMCQDDGTICRYKFVTHQPWGMWPTPDTWMERQRDDKYLYSSKRKRASLSFAGDSEILAFSYQIIRFSCLSFNTNSSASNEGCGCDYGHYNEVREARNTHGSYVEANDSEEPYDDHHDFEGTSTYNSYSSYDEYSDEGIDLENDDSEVTYDECESQSHEKPTYRHVIFSGGGFCCPPLHSSIERSCLKGLRPPPPKISQRVVSRVQPMVKMRVESIKRFHSMLVKASVMILTVQMYRPYKIIRTIYSDPITRRYFSPKKSHDHRVYQKSTSTARFVFFTMPKMAKLLVLDAFDQSCSFILGKGINFSCPYLAEITAEPLPPTTVRTSLRYLINNLERLGVLKNQFLKKTEIPTIITGFITNFLRIMALISYWDDGIWCEGLGGVLGLVWGLKNELDRLVFGLVCLFLLLKKLGKWRMSKRKTMMTTKENELLNVETSGVKQTSSTKSNGQKEQGERSSKIIEEFLRRHTLISSLDPNHKDMEMFKIVEDQDEAIQQGDSEIAEAWFDQAAEYWKQAIALTPASHQETKNVEITINKKYTRNMNNFNKKKYGNIEHLYGESFRGSVCIRSCQERKIIPTYLIDEVISIS